VGKAALEERYTERPIALRRALDTCPVVGVLAPYVEIFKATRTTMTSVLDHSLSTVVFIAFLVNLLC